MFRQITSEAHPFMTTLFKTQVDILHITLALPDTQLRTQMMRSQYKRGARRVAKVVGPKAARVEGVLEASGVIELGLTLETAKIGPTRDQSSVTVSC